MAKLTFTCVAQATIREYWSCPVPDAVIAEGPEVVHDYLLDHEGEWDFDGQDVVGNEEDREIETGSLPAFEVDAEPVTLTAPGKRVRDALSSILRYNWPAEQTDYEHAIEQGDIEPAPGSGHVYEALTIVRAYLDGTES